MGIGVFKIYTHVQTCISGTSVEGLPLQDPLV